MSARSIHAVCVIAGVVRLAIYLFYVKCGVQIDCEMGVINGDLDLVDKNPVLRGDFLRGAASRVTCCVSKTVKLLSRIGSRSLPQGILTPRHVWCLSPTWLEIVDKLLSIPEIELLEIQRCLP